MAKTKVKAVAESITSGAMPEAQQTKFKMTPYFGLRLCLLGGASLTSHLRLSYPGIQELVKEKLLQGVKDLALTYPQLQAEIDIEIAKMQAEDNRLAYEESPKGIAAAKAEKAATARREARTERRKRRAAIIAYEAAMLEWNTYEPTREDIEDFTSRLRRIEEEQAADQLSTARAWYALHPELVTSREFPESLVDGLRRYREDGEHFDPRELSNISDLFVESFEDELRVRAIETLRAIEEPRKPTFLDRNS